MNRPLHEKMITPEYSGNTGRKIQLKSWFFCQYGIKIDRLAKILYRHSTTSQAMKLSSVLPI